MKTIIKPNFLQLGERVDEAALARVANHPELLDDHRKKTRAYQDEVARSGGELQVRYRRAKMACGRPFARWYTSDLDKHVTCSTMWGPARSSICAHLHHDLDAPCCHQVLMLHELDAAKAAYPEEFAALDLDPLRTYCTDRDGMFAECDLDQDKLRAYNTDVKVKARCTTKDVFKSLVTICTFGGSKKTWRKKFKLAIRDYKLGTRVTQFIEASKGYNAALCRLPAFKGIVSFHEARKTQKGEEAHNGSRAAVILQTLEADNMLIAMTAFDAAGFPPVVYTYDGMQVEIPDSDERQQRFEAALADVNESLKPRGMSLILKEWKAPLDLEGVDPREADDDYDKILSLLMSHDAGRADLVAHFSGHRIKCVRPHEFYVCNEETSVWEKKCDRLMIAEVEKVGPLLFRYIDRRKRALSQELVALEERRDSSETSRAEQGKLAQQCKDLVKRNNACCKTLDGQFAAFSKEEQCKRAIAMLTHRVVDPHFASALDKVPGLLSVRNGMVDVRVSPPLLRERTPDDRVSYRMAYDYDPSAACPNFDKFVKGIFDNRRLRDQGHMAEAFVRRALGLNLFGFFAYMQCPALVFSGGGGNGKSLLLSIVQALCEKLGNGSLSQSLDSACLQDPSKDSTGNGPRGSIANLRGKRFAIVDETVSTEMHLGKGFRELCGSYGQKVTARDCHDKTNDDSTFEQNGGILIVCNKLPICGTNADQRRLTALPMYNSYKKKKAEYDDENKDHIMADLKLTELLLAEAAGIFAQLARCAAEGFAAFTQHDAPFRGVELPQAVLEHEQAYFAESDWTSMFEFKLHEKIKYSVMGHSSDDNIKGTIEEKFDTRGMKNADLLKKLQERFGSEVVQKKVDGTQYVLNIRVKPAPEPAAAAAAAAESDGAGAGGGGGAAFPGAGQAVGCAFVATGEEGCSANGTVTLTQ